MKRDVFAKKILTVFRGQWLTFHKAVFEPKQKENLKLLKNIRETWLVYFTHC